MHIMKIAICIPALLCFFTFAGIAPVQAAQAVQAPGMADPLAENMEIPPMKHNNMGRMTHGSSAQEYSDNGYLSGMIAHHEAAVQMSEEYLKNGRDDKVRGWAEDIIKNQRKEISDMNGWLGSFGGSDAAAARSMKDMMDAMMRKSYSSNPDANFVAMMMEHHAGAVNMAVDAIVHSRDERIVNLSKSIVEDQMEEILDFKEWLARNR